MEKVLIGFFVGDKKDDKFFGKMKRFNLVKDSRFTLFLVDSVSGLDVVINFEVSDELCLKRFVGRLRMYLILLMWIFYYI